VVGIPSGVGEKLDEEEPGWKISGKYVCLCSLIPTGLTDSLGKKQAVYGVR
jgi:hypothetical protein